MATVQEQQDVLRQMILSFRVNDLQVLLSKFPFSYEVLLVLVVSLGLLYVFLSRNVLNTTQKDSRVHFSTSPGSAWFRCSA